jgi:hypothetical protein
MKRLIIYSITSLVVIGDFSASAETSSKVQSNYFENKQEYERLLKNAAETGDYSKISDSAQSVQKSLNTAASDPVETAKIVGQAAGELALKETKRELPTPELLQKILLLQQIQIAQNNIIINLLSHIARDRQLHSVPSN